MGMNKSALTPGTTRKGRVRRSDSERLTSRVRPGVAPCVLKAVTAGNKIHIRMRDGDKLVAVVQRGRKRSEGYSYRLTGDGKIHAGFSSLREVVAKVATKL